MSSVLFGLPSLVANDQVKSSSDDEQLTKRSLDAVGDRQRGWVGQGATSTRPMSAQVAAPRRCPEKWTYQDVIWQR